MEHNLGVPGGHMALTFRMCLSFLCTVFLYPMKTDGANLALACHVLCQIRQFQQQGWLLFSHSVMSRCATPWTVARQASLFFTISQSLLKLVSIKSVMPSNHLILCCPLLLLPLVFPNISGFSQRGWYAKPKHERLQIFSKTNLSFLPFSIIHWNEKDSLMVCPLYAISLLPNASL